MKFGLLVGMMAAAYAAQTELSAGVREMLASIVAPTVVGVPLLQEEIKIRSVVL